MHGKIKDPWATAGTQEPENMFHLKALGSGLEGDLEGIVAPLSPSLLPPFLVMQSCTCQNQTPTSTRGGPLSQQLPVCC